MHHNIKTKIALPGFGMIDESKIHNNEKRRKAAKKDNDPWTSHTRIAKCDNCTREYPTSQDCYYCEM